MTKKSVWTTLASPFYDFGEESSKSNDETPIGVSSPVIRAAVEPVLAGSSPKADPALIASLDQSARAQLIAAMEASGASLAEELMDLLETLKENITGEEALYKTALKILVKKGHAIGDIRQDFDKAIGALEAKDREFGAELRGQLDKRVGSKMKTVEDCNAKVEDKQAQIAQLQSEILTLVTTAHEAQSGVSEEQNKLDLVQSRFTLGYKAISNEIQTNCTKVTQYGEKI